MRKVPGLSCIVAVYEQKGRGRREVAGRNLVFLSMFFRLCPDSENKHSSKIPFETLRTQRHAIPIQQTFWSIKIMLV